MLVQNNELTISNIFFSEIFFRFCNYMGNGCTTYFKKMTRLNKFSQFKCYLEMAVGKAY